MTIKKFCSVTLALVVLTALMASTAFAERLQTRTTQGNNLGYTVGLGWSSPFTARSLQYPRGSGNFITNDGNTIGSGVYRDLNGDGTYEDTVGTEHLRAHTGALASLEQRDLILSVISSVTPGAVGGELGKAIYNRIWTSLDADELAEWPPEGRIGRTASGAPNVAAAGETMFFNTENVFTDWGYDRSCPHGAYMGWTLRMLDFAESNDIMFINLFVRNMSEYAQYNPNSTVRANVVTYPNYQQGFTWGGVVLVKNNRNFYFNGDRPGWGYHPEKEIVLWHPTSTAFGGWNPPPAPMNVFTVLKYPELHGETMALTSVHNHGSSSDFGFTSAQQLFVVSNTWSVPYLAAQDKVTGHYSGVLNPYTGKPVRGAFPGRLDPSDARYSQWIWGGNRHWMSYTCFGELHDVAPRESFEMDAAIMMVPCGVSDFVRPDMVDANMDDPMMQQLFAPAEDWKTIAKIVVDGGYQVPVAPTSPQLTIIPGDRMVTLTWSDVALQTPDPYYAFLQANPELDPTGMYRQFDFEGYRVYRSYVGPSDSHSELLADYSLGGGNLQFHYIDRLSDDEPYFRMRNGQKVWYAVVAYDRNIDPASGTTFSLPDPAGGKTWNRPGDNLYQVISRSDASDFREASIAGVTYDGPATVSAGTATLTGDGTGKLTEAPKWLEPQMGEVILNTVNNEKITSDRTLYIETAAWWHNEGGCWGGNRPSGIRKFKLVSGSQESVSPTVVRGNGAAEQTVLLYDTPASDGLSLSLDATLSGLGRQNIITNNFIHNIDTGTYTGVVENWSATGCGEASRSRMAAPNMTGMMRNGRFTITWKSTSTGMTIEVQDLTRGTTVPFTEYQDENGWGIMTAEGYGVDSWTRRHWGGYFTETFLDSLPKSERTNLMVSELPNDYDSPIFAVWLNGLAWWFESGVVPANGTVMTVDCAWGVWNSDKTAFTQYADMPWLGDKWKVDIAAMTQNPEDADLSRIKVVPNPYMASSFLDLSPANRRVEFVNLPSQCTIRIYTLSGNLVNVLNHIGINRQGWGNYTDWDRLKSGTSDPAVYTGYDNHTGTEPWNLRNRFGQIVASGLYLYHVTDQRGETFTGKFYVVN